MKPPGHMQNEYTPLPDANTHREAFGLQAHAVAVQRGVYILCRVTRSQYYGSSLDEVVAYPYAFNACARGVQLKACNFARKVYLTTRLRDSVADVADYAWQTVGADVGVCLVENLWRSTMKNKRL